MLSAANYLQTNAEPRLVRTYSVIGMARNANTRQYYRPWELRPDEEDRIDEQLKDARARVDREVAELEGRSDASHSAETGRYRLGPLRGSCAYDGCSTTEQGRW